jgi:hypothetical protein
VEDNYLVATAAHKKAFLEQKAVHNFPGHLAVEVAN